LLIIDYLLTSNTRLQCYRVSKSSRHRAYQDQMTVFVYFLVRVVKALVVLLSAIQFSLQFFQIAYAIASALKNNKYL